MYMFYTLHIIYIRLKNVKSNLLDKINHIYFILLIRNIQIHIRYNYLKQVQSRLDKEKHKLYRFQSKYFQKYLIDISLHLGRILIHHLKSNQLNKKYNLIGLNMFSKDFSILCTEGYSKQLYFSKIQQDKYYGMFDLMNGSKILYYRKSNQKLKVRNTLSTLQDTKGIIWQNYHYKYFNLIKNNLMCIAVVKNLNNGQVGKKSILFHHFNHNLSKEMYKEHIHLQNYFL